MLVWVRSCFGFVIQNKRQVQIQTGVWSKWHKDLAERTIQTFTSHFIAILTVVKDTFPMRLWDKLLDQTIVTLNLFRQSNTVPLVSTTNMSENLLITKSSTRTNGKRSTNAWKQKQLRHMGWTIIWWIVPRNVTGTLPMSHHSCQENKEQKNIRHSIFQAQAHCTTITHPSWHSGQSNQWPYMHIERCME